MSITHARLPLLLSIALIAVLLLPLMAHAASVQWNSNVNVNITLKQVVSIGTLEVRNLQASVSYYADVINKNSGQVLGTSATVPHGTRLSFRFLPHENSHIFWYTSGNFADTPNGTWKSGADRPGDLCSRGDNKIADAGGWEGKVEGKKKKGDRVYWSGYAHYVASPPSKSISGLGGANCSGSSSSSMECTFNKAGTYNVAFDFNSASGRLWAGAAEKGDSSCELTGADSVNVPAQRITYTITVEPEKKNQPPSTPNVISSSGACIVGQSHTISMTSTDSDTGDQLRYLIDWDNNGSVDQIVPPSGYVNPGTTQTASRTFSTAGSKTVKVRSEDTLELVHAHICMQ